MMIKFLTAIDSVTNGHLDNAAKSMFPKWQKTDSYAYDLGITTSNIRDIPSFEYVNVYANTSL